MRASASNPVAAAFPARRTTLPALLALAALLAVGCNSVGPRAIRGARFPYNEALVQTANEQLLLNLVRLRYRDTPYFLEVTSLTTQYELSGALDPGVTLVEGGGDEGGIGGEVAIAETPTVSYVPLQGEDFVKQLLRRVPLDDVMLLPQSGWSIERVMRLTVDEIDGIRNAPTTTGPTPDTAPDYEAFNCLAATLRMLQRQRRLRLHVQPVAEPKGDAGSTADDEFDYTLEIADGPTPEPPPGCTADAAGRVREVLERGSFWPIRHPWEAGETGISLTTRSLMGALNYLSQAVEVPAEHLEAGLATPTGPELGGCTLPAGPGPATMAPGLELAPAEIPEPSSDWAAELYRNFFRIHCSPTRPTGAFTSVRYRGAWFYIADNDLQTKSTWGLLAQLVSLQAGAEARGLVPTLTLNAGR